MGRYNRHTRKRWGATTLGGNCFSGEQAAYSRLPLAQASKGRLALAKGHQHVCYSYSLRIASFKASDSIVGWQQPPRRRSRLPHFVRSTLCGAAQAGSGVRAS